MPGRAVVGAAVVIHPALAALALRAKATRAAMVALLACTAAVEVAAHRQ
jgi:hypothetical protein